MSKEVMSFGFGMLTVLFGWFACLEFGLISWLMFGIYFIAALYMIWRGVLTA